MREEKKAIVLGADNAYMNKVETTIKSLCVHHDNLKFYVFNDDFPREWFQLMEKRLETLNSEIVNVQIDSSILKDYRLPFEGLSYATFFRYFIPKYVSESRALYLDSDIIVRKPIDELWDLDLTDIPLAAVRDDFYTHIFNAGFLLINNDMWRAENVTQDLIELTNQYHQTDFGDQGILNRLFENRWKELEPIYNFMVGMDTIAYFQNKNDWYPHAELLEASAKMIHYTGKKPWQQITINRLREEWWFYYGLEWSDVLLRKFSLESGYRGLVKKVRARTAVVTITLEMPHLEFLVKNCPDVEFHLLAPTNFAGSIMALQGYTNVRLYPNCTLYNVDSVLSQLDFYLDINADREMFDVISKAKARQLPILAWDTTNRDTESYSQIVSEENPQEMLELIEKLLSK
ncbi:glycosyltransferase [Streptococcus mitis]|uniref:Putative CDP-glycerol:glycerophosphate glycerophosphotransferase n=1 Tax=Streptococcus mitis TaxID=28037 RepID=A0A139QBK0_STRMT|nr:glycosyltransferase [Streptococcus mitis]KXT99945.1 putative CDP-glycerol:glycerophosphate glycerophosphotransferase [Streptococcus mitis]